MYMKNVDVRKTYRHVYERPFLCCWVELRVFVKVYFYEQFYYQIYLAIIVSSKYI